MQESFRRKATVMMRIFVFDREIQALDIMNKNQEWDLTYSTDTKKVKIWIMIEKLKNITNENNLLLYKMIKIDEGHSKYNDPSFRHTFSQMRNNFLISKFNDRKRSLSEIMKSNKVCFYLSKKLNTKLTRCASSQKLSECGKWK